MAREPDRTAHIDLSGQVIWVIGAGGGGIGTALCVEFARAGAQVVAVDREESALAPTLDAIAALPEPAGSCLPHVADALDAAQLDAMADARRVDAGPPTGLVNVVGGLARERWAAVVDASEDDFSAVLDLNLRAAWLSSRLFGRERLAAGGGGAAVQLTSIAALQGMPFGATYAAARAALISLTRTLALEWGAAGIRVNALAAGSVHVPRSPSVDPERDAAVIPLGRRGTPRDVSGAALFLLSDLAAWITGQVLVVDGGASIRPGYLDGEGLPVFVEDEALRARLRAQR